MVIEVDTEADIVVLLGEDFHVHEVALALLIGAALFLARAHLPAAVPALLDLDLLRDADLTLVLSPLVGRSVE